MFLLIFLQWWISKLWNSSKEYLSAFFRSHRRSLLTMKSRNPWGLSSNESVYYIYVRVQWSLITTLVNLLVPTIRRCMRSYAFMNFSKLLAKALVVKQDEEEEMPKFKSKKEAAEKKCKATPAKKSETSPPRCWYCQVLNECQTSKNWRQATEPSATTANGYQAWK